VFVKDGHQELVRGATFNDLDTRTLRTDIIAAGNDQYVYNIPEPLPKSIVAPRCCLEIWRFARLKRGAKKSRNTRRPAKGA